MKPFLLTKYFFCFLPHTAKRKSLPKALKLSPKWEKKLDKFTLKWILWWEKYRSKSTPLPKDRRLANDGQGTQSILDAILNPKRRTLWLVLIFSASFLAAVLLVKVTCLWLYRDDGEQEGGALMGVELKHRLRNCWTGGGGARAAGHYRMMTPVSPVSPSDAEPVTGMHHEHEHDHPVSPGCHLCGDVSSNKSNRLQLKSVLSNPVVRLPSNSDAAIGGGGVGGGGTLILKPIVVTKEQLDQQGGVSGVSGPKSSNSFSLKTHGNQLVHHHFSNTPMGSSVASARDPQPGAPHPSARPISELGGPRILSGGAGGKSGIK